MSRRTCHRKGCDTSLDGRRVDAKWCSASCEREARRERERAQEAAMVWVRGHYRKRAGKASRKAA